MMPRKRRAKLRSILHATLRGVDDAIRSVLGPDTTISEQCNECWYRYDECGGDEPACFGGGCDRAGPTRDEKEDWDGRA